MNRFNLKHLLIWGGFPVLMLFQNCGQEVQFQDQNNTMLKSGELVGLSEDEPDNVEMIDMMGVPVVLNDDDGVEEEQSDEQQEEMDNSNEQGATEEDKREEVAKEEEQPKAPVVKEEDKKEEVIAEDDSDEEDEMEADRDVASDDGDCQENCGEDDVKENNGQKPEKVAESEDDDDSDKDEESNDEELASNSEEDHYSYRCVIEGKGKSVHIGFLDGKAAADKNTPDQLCMSKMACLDIMSTAFNVKEAKFTGNCKQGTPQVKVISDAEAVDLALQALEN